MRKIEIQMLNAIDSKRNWTMDNTLVHIENGGGNPFGLRAEIYLHGNHIADVINSNMVGDVITPRIVDVNKETLRQWSTPTTKSRLRALGANVATRKGITYLDNVAI